MKLPKITERHRAYAYRVMCAAAAVAVGYGVLTSNEAVLWLGLANALAAGPAAANTSTARHVEA